jgi:alpha-mannosidase
MKKSEKGDDLIVRVYNITSKPEHGRLLFNELISISATKLVNFLEEPPQNEIKASVNIINHNTIEIDLEPNVIATVRIKVKK